jgi:hypothetical protein
MPIIADPPSPNVPVASNALLLPSEWTRSIPGWAAADSTAAVCAKSQRPRRRCGRLLARKRQIQQSREVIPIGQAERAMTLLRLEDIALSLHQRPQRHFN